MRRLLAGAPMPILGDDPRSLAGRKVFKAAPLSVDGRDAGYVYVVLQGEGHDAVAANVAAEAPPRARRCCPWAWWRLCWLVAGLVAFGLITRPLRRLTAVVRRFESRAMKRPPRPLARRRWHAPCARPAAAKIGVLEQAFRQMTRRIAEQWRELTSPGSAAARAVRQRLARPAHAADLAARLSGNALLMKAGTLDGASASVT